MIEPNKYEVAQERIKDLKRMTLECGVEINEMLRAVAAYTSDIKSRMGVMEENRAEITKLEEEINLMGAGY